MPMRTKSFGCCLWRRGCPIASFTCPAATFLYCAIIRPTSAECFTCSNRPIANRCLGRAASARPPIRPASGHDSRRRVKGLGSATVPVAMGRVSRPTSAPIPSHGFIFGWVALKERPSRNVFGGTPNTSCETHALPESAAASLDLLKTSRNHVSQQKGRLVWPARFALPPGKHWNWIACA